MHRVLTHRSFPWLAALFGAAAAFGALAAELRPDHMTAIALGLAVVAAVMAARNWGVAEIERPLLIEELGELNDAADVLLAEREARLARRRAAAEARAAERAPDAMREPTAPSAPAQAEDKDPSPSALESKFAAHEARLRRLAERIDDKTSTRRAPTDREPEASDADPDIVDVTSATTAPKRAPAPAPAPVALAEPALRPVVSLTDQTPRFFETVLDRAAGAGGDRAMFEGSLLALDRLRPIDPAIGVFCALSVDALRGGALADAIADATRRDETLIDRLVFELPQSDVAELSESELLLELDSRGFPLSLSQFADVGAALRGVDPRRISRAGFRFIRLDGEALLAQESAEVGAIAAFSQALNRAGVRLIVERVSRAAQADTFVAIGASYGVGPAFGEGAALGAALAQLERSRSLAAGQPDRAPAAVETAATDRLRGVLRASAASRRLTFGGEPLRRAAAVVDVDVSSSKQDDAPAKASD